MSPKGQKQNDQETTSKSTNKKNAGTVASTNKIKWKTKHFLKNVKKGKKILE